MFFAIMSHKDNITVGSPDQPCQFECIVWTWWGRLDRRHLVCFNTAELRCRVQHSNTSQKRGVHLPKRDMTVCVGISGKVPSVRSKSHSSYWPFMTMDSLTFSSPDVVEGHWTMASSNCYSVTPLIIADHVEPANGWEAFLESLFFD